jgi:hypothetical protein
MPVILFNRVVDNKRKIGKMFGPRGLDLEKNANFCHK